METSIEYRLITDATIEHERPLEEGVVVRMTAVRTEPGQPVSELDMNESADMSTFYSNYESFKVANAVSSVSNVNNVYFREIAKMGQRAVPFIYKEMQKGPTDLVYVLDEIFNHPIKYSGFVPLKQICDTWISILKQTGRV